jgi:hypothetical protein
MLHPGVDRSSVSFVIKMESDSAAKSSNSESLAEPRFCVF